MPYLADEQRGDRNPGRLALGVLAGIVAGIVGAALAFIATTAAFTAVTMVSGVGNADGTVSLQSVFTDPSLTAHDVRRALYVTVVTAMVNLGALGGFVVAAGLVLKRRLKSYLTVMPRIRWGLLLTGALLNIAILAPLTLWENWTQIAAGQFPLASISPSLVSRLVYAGVTVFALTAAAFAEEIFFRGWLMRHLSAVLRVRWAAILLTAIGFSALHLDFNPDAFITRTIMGLGFAWMTLRLGGLELSTGAHMANNLVIALLIENISLTPEAPHALPPTFYIEAVAVALGYLAITEIAVRLFPPRPREPVEPPGSVIAA